MQHESKYFIDEDNDLCMLLDSTAVVIACLDVNKTTMMPDAIGKEWPKGYYDISKYVQPSEFELFDDDTYKLK